MYFVDLICRLNLSKNSLTIEDVEALTAAASASGGGPAAAASSKLASLALGGNSELVHMTGGQWAALLASGSASCFKLDVRCCALQDDGLRVLLPVLTASKRRVSVNLRSNALTRDGVRDMMVCMRYSHIAKIVLAHNAIGSAGAAMLARAFQSFNFALEALDVSGCSLTDNGMSVGPAIELILALNDARSLNWLSIAGNQLAPQRMVATDWQSIALDALIECCAVSSCSCC